MKSIITALAAAIVMSVMPIQALAQEDVIDGGWIEGVGNYVNAPADGTSATVQSVNGEIVPLGSAKHSGYLESKYSNGVMRKRMIATTRWPGVRHYTVALLKRSGRVVSTSGKRWGVGRSAAITGWWNVTRNGNVTGESYYGRR